MPVTLLSEDHPARDPYAFKRPDKESPQIKESQTENDNRTVISDITEDTTCKTIATPITEEQINTLVTELNKLTLDALKNKCRDNGLTGHSKSSKPMIVAALVEKCRETCKKMNGYGKVELKQLCKTFDIKGISTMNKEQLMQSISNHLIQTIQFNIQMAADSEDAKVEPKAVDEKEKETREKEEKLKMEAEKKESEKEMREKLEKELKLLQEKEEKMKMEVKLEAEKKESEKKKKQAIPKNVKTIVWNHYIGEDIIKHKCLCCKKVSIMNTNFDVGHVLSEANGGTHEISNLRPICSACNHSMKTENMVDFVIKYGLYIG